MRNCRAWAALATGLLIFAGGAALMLGPITAGAQEPDSATSLSSATSSQPIDASPSATAPATRMSVGWSTLRTGLLGTIAGFGLLMAALIWRTRIRERRNRAALSQMMLSPFHSSSVKPSFSVTPLRPETPPADSPLGTLPAIEGGWKAVKAGLISAVAGYVVFLAARMLKSRMRTLRSLASKRYPRQQR